MVLAGIECSPKIRDFRASGIPDQERVDFFDTLTASQSGEAVFSANKRLKVYAECYSGASAEPCQITSSVPF